MRARTASVLVLLLVLGFVVSCSSDDGSEPGDEVDAVLQQALQAHADGDLDTAADLYKQVIVLDPQNEFAYYNLGLIHQTEGRLGAAAENYELALDIDPEFRPALFNLATVRTGLDQPDEAIDLYRRLLELAPDNAAAHLNLGFALIDIGEGKEGKAELATAVELDPSLESRVPERLLVVGGATGP